jgi:hypothetical protein
MSEVGFEPTPSVEDQNAGSSVELRNSTLSLAP